MHKVYFPIHNKMLVQQVLYNWYHLQAFNFRYIHASHDSAK